MGVQQRRQRQREGLRQEILDAARALFVKDGYENVSIRKIADRIEYAPGTIYLYFKDKSDIFETLCEESFAKLSVRLGAIVADRGEPLEKLRRAGRAYVEFAVQNPNHYMAAFVLKSTYVSQAKGPTRFQSSGLACFNNLREVVQQCVQHGRLRITDVEEVSQALWACVHGIATLLISQCGFPFVEQSRLIDRVVDLAVEGVRKK
jgi:AcrR family transcriptional regulator